MDKNVLIYAFFAWGKNNRNLSEEVLNQIRLPVSKIVLKTRFDEQIFLDLLDQGYTHIIGLGQYPVKGDSIRIEQVAQNSFGTSSSGYQPINTGPDKLHVDLFFETTKHSIQTYDAGKFVCNYSMYTILSNKSDSLKYAFLHIPKNISVKCATTFVEEIIKQIF